MFEKLKQFLKGDPPPISERVTDPCLGTLTWSKDDEAWLSDPAFQGIGFRFQISGTPEPDKNLIAHAIDIVRSKDQFLKDVGRFLEEESTTVRHLQPYREEIKGLRLEVVCLFWPDRPDDGMLTFDGGLDFRAWRCDYIARKPKGLGFDD